MAETTIPDILHPIPRNRINVDATKLSIALAFASGVSGGLFSDALDRANVAPSTWQPAAFVSDLFVSQFASLCFRGEKSRFRRSTSSGSSPPRPPIARRSITGAPSSPSSRESDELRGALDELDITCGASARSSRARRASASGTRTGGSSTSSQS